MTRLRAVLRAIWAIVESTGADLNSEPRWPAVINGHKTRPHVGECPDCGADEVRWCAEGCLLLDPMDYR